MTAKGKITNLKRVLSAGSVSAMAIVLIAMASAAGNRADIPEGCIALENWELIRGTEHVKTPPVPWDKRGIPGQTGVYRIEFILPASAGAESYAFFTESLDDADEAYLNGELIGCTGIIPLSGCRAFRSGVREPRLYLLPVSALKKEVSNTLEIKVFNYAGLGGFTYPQNPLVGPYGLLKLKEWRYKILNDYVRLLLAGGMICIAVIILYQLISFSDKSAMIFTMNKVIEGMNPLNIFRRSRGADSSDYKKEITYKYAVSLFILLFFTLYLFSELPGKYILIESEEFWFRAPLIFLMSGMILTILLFYSDVFREGGEGDGPSFNLHILMKIVTHPSLYFLILGALLFQPVDKAWSGFTVAGIAAVTLCFFTLIIRSIFILIYESRKAPGEYSSRLRREGIIRIILLTGFTGSFAVFSYCGSAFYMHSSIISISMLTVYMFLSVSFNIRFKTEFPVYTPDRDSLTLFLRDNYNLSITEAAIANYINKGAAREEICRIFNITQGTLKNHLKSIYSKTIELNSSSVSSTVGKYQKLTVFLHNIYNMSHNDGKKL